MRRKIRVSCIGGDKEALDAGQRRAVSRRVWLPALSAGIATAAGRVQAVEEEQSSATPLAVKAAKLGGILVAADVVTSLVLGRSVLGLLNKNKPQGEGRDWKEAAADKLLASWSKPSGEEDKPPVAEMESQDVSPALRRVRAHKARAQELIARVSGRSTPPPDLRFEDVMAVIDQLYVVPKQTFRTGVGSPKETVNPPGANTGALRVLVFGTIHNLSEGETLSLFAQHATDVLATPEGTSHGNIRGFMANGWAGVRLDINPRVERCEIPIGPYREA